MKVEYDAVEMPEKLTLESVEVRYWVVRGSEG